VPSARMSDQTAPSLRNMTGYLCPRCERRFPETDVVPSHCPNDNTPVVRMRDWAEKNADPMVGKVLDGRFTLVAKLGAGSMGTVYRARQDAIGREVAIKILRSDKALDEPSKARFLREARAHSLLASPHTVTVFDFGQSESGEFFLAMELLEGESLGARIQRLKRIPVEMAVDTTRQALRSLAEAHAKGIVHRDLKPDNLFYARVLHGGQNEEIVKVLDFGIAKMLGEGMDAINAIETQAGTVFGTPRYMSPEQAQAKPLDARSDLYSLGVLLYHMLSGRPPFTDDDAIIVMARHIKTAPKPIAEVCPGLIIPPEIEKVMMRAMGKLPSQRPANAEAMSQELARALELSRSLSSGVRPSLPGSVPPAAHSLRMMEDDTSIDLTSAGTETERRERRRPGPARYALIGLVLFVVAVVAVGIGVRIGRRDDPAATAVAPIAVVNQPPTAVASGVTAPANSFDLLPTIDVANLPKTGDHPPAKTSGKPTAGRPPHRSPGSGPPPPASSAGKYGILE
jgi:serine/threonine protein kinase